MKQIVDNLLQLQSWSVVTFISSTAFYIMIISSGCSYGDDRRVVLPDNFCGIATLLFTDKVDPEAVTNIDSNHLALIGIDTSKGTKLIKIFKGEKDVSGLVHVLYASAEWEGKERKVVHLVLPCADVVDKYPDDALVRYYSPQLSSIKLDSLFEAEQSLNSIGD